MRYPELLVTLGMVTPIYSLSLEALEPMYISLAEALESIYENRGY